MRRSILGLAVVAAALAVGLGAAAGTPMPRLQAQAYYVESDVDGTVVAQRNAAQARPVASITKLMTVLVALERTRLDDVVVVPASATGIGESTVNLRPGERLTVRDLAVAALVPSANDAATALAYHAGNGSVARFVGLMNAKARALGLRETHYVNPHGLDAPGHVSSARDSVRLLQSALVDPFLRIMLRARRWTLSDGREVSTTDDLLSRYAPMTAGKTGHTAGAGWSQVAVAKRGTVTVYAAVLGEPSRERRNDDLQALFDWAIAEYPQLVVVSPTRTYAHVDTPYGRPDVRLVASGRTVRPVRVGRALVERVVAPSAVLLPVRRGQVLGEVRVYDGKRLLGVSPLVAAEAVAEPGLPGKVRWYATRTAHHLVELFS